MSEGYFRGLSEAEPEDKTDSEYFTDDEIEGYYAHSRDDELGELILGDEN